jgi:L-threonylcarbamoyladenylate synthase
MTRAASNIDEAVAVLRRGGLVAFPTETVYGLGADAANSDALRRLYRVKRRPVDHPVIVHVADTAALDDYAIDPPPVAHALARAFWPGPLTLVVRKRAERVADEATGGGPTVGLRVPDHPLALELLRAFAGGIAAPSANRFGRVSPTTAAHVRADLGSDVDLVLDGGPSRVGVESTIVDVSGDTPAILRAGGVSEADIARIAGGELPRRDRGEVAAPGTLPTHYAPNARVELVERAALAARAAELVAAGTRTGVLALDPPRDLPPAVVVLEPPSDIDDYARVLYARFRAADDSEIAVLLVVPPPARGVGVAVCDRLHRASADRTASRQ